MGLARVAAVARVLGLDQPACPVITVGGTNGKGSTVAHLEALVRAAGASTGSFTSPHFVRYNERIRVDGVEVGDAELSNAFERIESARGTTTLTFFEYNTLAALLLFADRAVDVAILEVGLGGRLDATNLIDADVAVVCSIGFDHQDWLGDSLELIGAEKAGIFRSGRPAVLGTHDMPASVFSIIARLDAHAVVAGKDFRWRVEPPREIEHEATSAQRPTNQTRDFPATPGEPHWSYEDRKSTRLNSSHGYISYAVFCLKKKKQDKLTSRSCQSAQYPRTISCRSVRTFSTLTVITQSAGTVYTARTRDWLRGE